MSFEIMTKITVSVQTKGPLYDKNDCYRLKIPLFGKQIVLISVTELYLGYNEVKWVWLSGWLEQNSKLVQP